MIARLIAFLNPYRPIDYATSSLEKYLRPLPWSIIGTMLSNNTARAVYVLPFAGYIILYSDYFEKLFKFSGLSSHWGFLTFTGRVNMIYYGSIILVIAFLLYGLSPRLLRSKRDRQHFVADLITARDKSTVRLANRDARQYLQQYLEKHETDLSESDRGILQGLLHSMNRENLGDNAGEYESLIPQILIFYFNWQNFRCPVFRTLVLCFTLIGYVLLGLPALDLFLRVLHTSVSQL